MQDIGLRCKYPEHNQKEINLLCLNQLCDKIRPACSDCLRYFHQQHLSDLIDFTQFYQEKQKNFKIIEKIRQFISDVRTVTELMKKLFSQQMYNVNTVATTEKWNDQAKQLMFLKSLNEQIGKEIEQNNNSLQMIKQKLLQTNKQFMQYEKKEDQKKQQQNQIISQQVQNVQQLNKRFPTQIDSPYEKVPIYFVCLRKPQCMKEKQHVPYKHSKCGTIAYFHTNGQISCLGNCSTYSIKEARFCCKNNLICQNDMNLNEKDYEKVEFMFQFADFVYDCLNFSNYSIDHQAEFQSKVMCGGLKFYLC